MSKAKDKQTDETPADKPPVAPDSDHPDHPDHLEHPDHVADGAANGDVQDDAMTHPGGVFRQPGVIRLAKLLKFAGSAATNEVCNEAAEVIERMRAVNKPASVFARR